MEFDATRAERSVLAQIREEQSRGRYDCLYGFRRFEGWSKFPAWPGVIVKGRPTHAAGAYQFEPATWAEAEKATGVKDFSPQSQDVCALWLLRHFSQKSQWGTNFEDDGFWYAFAAAEAPAALSEEVV